MTDASSSSHPIGPAAPSTMNNEDENAITFEIHVVAEEEKKVEAVSESASAALTQTSTEEGAPPRCSMYTSYYSASHCTIVQPLRIITPSSDTTLGIGMDTILPLVSRVEPSSPRPRYAEVGYMLVFVKGQSTAEMSHGMLNRVLNDPNYGGKKNRRTLLFSSGRCGHNLKLVVDEPTENSSESDGRSNGVNDEIISANDSKEDPLHHSLNNAGDNAGTSDASRGLTDATKVRIGSVSGSPSSRDSISSTDVSSSCNNSVHTATTVALKPTPSPQPTIPMHQQARRNKEKDRNNKHSQTITVPASVSSPTKEHTTTGSSLLYNGTAIISPSTVNTNFDVNSVETLGSLSPLEYSKKGGDDIHSCIVGTNITFDTASFGTKESSTSLILNKGDNNDDAIYDAGDNHRNAASAPNPHPAILGSVNNVHSNESMQDRDVGILPAESSCPSMRSFLDSILLHDIIRTAPPFTEGRKEAPSYHGGSIHRRQNRRVLSSIASLPRFSRDKAEKVFIPAQELADKMRESRKARGNASAEPNVNAHKETEPGKIEAQERAEKMRESREARGNISAMPGPS